MCQSKELTFKLITNCDLEEYKYYGYGIAFDVRRSFSLCNGSGFAKNAIIFGVGMSSSEHVNNKKKIS